ncbi:NlpC/P60 family protein [Streptomyces sp. NPDC059009]|uniref:C40 family peptidase n=1 Tax=Streptomyces sp. NPDC059009 TaxID=3346694 RepID=UPI0036914A13
MSGKLLQRVCTAAVAGVLLAAAPPSLSPFPFPSPAYAAPVPAPGPGVGGAAGRSVAELLTDLQGLYQKAEEASEAYNTTADKLKKQRAEVRKLGGELSKARTSVRDSKGAAGRFAREQYQGGIAGEYPPYLRLLLARDPQQALDQGHVLGRVAAERAAAVERLVGGERKAAGLAGAAQQALTSQLALAEREKKDRDTVKKQLNDVEELLAALSEDQLAQLRQAEDAGTADAQRKFLASGALSGSAGAAAAGAPSRAPSREGDRALAYAVRQIGKPYEWGAQGPKRYDCSGLTSQAWGHAGRDIPRTSQEQWAQLPRVPLSELRPGDLVIYFPKATHVALYLGDGMVVQAPRLGARVKVSPIAANPLLGAVRPDPGAGAMGGYRPPRLPRGAMSGSDLGYGEVGPPPAAR